MAKISDFCQLGRHNQCPVQQLYDRDYPDKRIQAIEEEKTTEGVF